MTRNCFAILLAGAALCAGQAIAGLDIPWSSIDSGSGALAGGAFTLSGTIGQPDADDAATPIVGGNFSLVGGYWTFVIRTTRGDMNCDGNVNNFDIDPFVLALIDPQTYGVQYPSCYALNGDIDQSGGINNFDIDPFVTCILGGGCP